MTTFLLFGIYFTIKRRYFPGKFKLAGINMNHTGIAQKITSLYTDND
jgi:hypothetical protein